MGYLKFKNASNEDWGGGLISTENVDAIRLASGTIQVDYSAGTRLTIEGDGGFSQDDINTVIKGVNILNGSSGSNLDIELSDEVYDVYVGTIP
jgi:hypothetical protein